MPVTISGPAIGRRSVSGVRALDELGRRLLNAWRYQSRHVETSVGTVHVWHADGSGGAFGSRVTAGSQRFICRSKRLSRSGWVRDSPRQPAICHGATPRRQR